MVIVLLSIGVVVGFSWLFFQCLIELSPSYRVRADQVTYTGLKRIWAPR